MNFYSFRRTINFKACIMRIFILLTLAINFCLFSQNKIDTKEKEVEKIFLNLVDPNSFKSHLEELTKNPHVSGSIANEHVQNYIK